MVVHGVDGEGKAHEPGSFHDELYDPHQKFFAVLKIHGVKVDKLESIHPPRPSLPAFPANLSNGRKC